MSAQIDTKSLFISLVKRWQCDLVLDIGSRDGKQSLLFKDVLPNATVVAFEANPKNYQKMTNNPALSGRVTILPIAVSDNDGTASFHIAQADYDGPETAENNLGISSLLDHPGVKTAETVSVKTVRLDSLLKSADYQKLQRIALWVDVESAEYWVLAGMHGIANRVHIVHVETARSPMRTGQRTYDEVSALLGSMKFTEIGSSIGPNDTWGDVVFVRNDLVADTRAAQSKAALGKLLHVNHIAAFLGRRFPLIYRLTRKAFLRSI